MADEKETIFWRKTNGHITDSSHDDKEHVNGFDKVITDLKVDDQSHVSNSEPTEDSETKQKKLMNKKTSPETKKKWKPGGQCLAIYSADGLYYEATILSTNYDKKTVEVKFSYYGNDEEVNMNNLLPMECKSEMSIVPNYSAYVKGDRQVSSDETCMSNKYNRSTLKNNWRISDICYVLNKNGDYEQAVINSFKSSDVCHVTIIKTHKKKEVRISQLCSSIPSLQKKSRKTSRCHCTSSEVNGSHSDIPMYIPPPPPTLQPNSGFPNLTSMPSFSPWKQTDNIPYDRNGFNSNIPNGMNSNIPNGFKSNIPNGFNSNIPNGFNSNIPNRINSSIPNGFNASIPNGINSNIPNGINSNIPKCPPLPVMSDDVIAGNEEALANMLMSWYISGFHTGYYQGMRKFSSSENIVYNNHYRKSSDVGRKASSRRWGNTLV